MSSAMKVANFNGCKVYNLTGDGKIAPSFMTDAKKRELSRDADYRRRVEVLQDFEMATASQCVKMTADKEHVILTGGYPPLVRCYTVSDMSLKFQRGLTSDVVAFECLSDDYGKMVFLQADRTLAFHAPYGTHYNVRVPKFGRDLVYGWDNCDLYVASSGEELYRINLEAGQFKEPLKLGFEGCNKVRINSMHRLLACGGEGGIVELWDVRAKRKAAEHRIATTSGGEDVTALTWDTDGLTLAVGSSAGNCMLYDIRSSVPVHTKEHQYGLPINEVTFHNDSRHVLSSDSKTVKIWERDEPNMGKVLTNIEAPADINAMHVVSDQRGQSGLIFLAGEQSRVMTYFVPQLGPAPRWCSFLEALTEELEEDASNTVYEDYKFVTKAELAELGATALIGTPMLKGYMHGYFMEMKLYGKLRAVSKPFEYDEHRKKKIRDKIEEKRASRIITQKRIPKVNKELAAKMLKTKEVQKSRSAGEDDGADAGDSGDVALVDERFSALFNREEFEQDRESYDYQLRNPTAPRKRNGGNDGDSDDDLTHLYTEVDGNSSGNASESDYDDEDDDMGDDYSGKNDASDSDDLEIRAPDASDAVDEARGPKKRTNAKALAKEMKRRKQADADRNDDDDQGAIIRASLKAAKKKKEKKSEPRFYEISDTYIGSKAGALGMDSNDARKARRAEKEMNTVPLAERVSKNKSSQRRGTEEGPRTIKSSKGFVKELTFFPKEKEKSKKSKR